MAEVFRVVGWGSFCWGKRTFATFRTCLSRPAPSYWHEPGSHPLVYKTIGQLLEQAADKYGDREAIISVREGVRLSFKDLLRQADELAAGLRGLGLQSGEHVVVWSPNSWKWVVSRLAVARAGLVSVDMNPLYREQEAAHCLRLSRAAAVIAAEEHRGLRYHEILAAVAPEIPRASGGAIHSTALPELRNFISMSDNPIPGAVRYADVVAAATEEAIRSIRAEQDAINPEGPCNIQFSSGTTGTPKAILLRHSSFVNNAFTVGRRLDMDGRHHKVCVLVPFFHVFGSVVSLCSSLQHGSTVVIPSHQGYDPKYSLEAIRKERCSVLTGTPTMYIDIVRLLEGEGRTLDCVEIAACGGAPVTPQLIRKMMTVLGLKRTCSIFGMSETTAVSFQGVPTDSVDEMANTVGKTCEHVEAKVVDESGRVVPCGTPGELYVRGYHTMIGYFGDEEATQKTLVDGWIKTGDKFVLQEDGYGRIVGRLKDMIIRGGENIFPIEIEDLLATHPNIYEVQVVGVPDERMGEEVCACVRVRGLRGSSQVSVSVTEMRQFCKGKIASHKIPRYLAVWTDFPKTSSGKVQKFRLRQECEKLLEKGELGDAFAKK